MGPSRPINLGILVALGSLFLQAPVNGVCSRHIQGKILLFWAGVFLLGVAVSLGTFLVWSNFRWVEIVKVIHMSARTQFPRRTLIVTCSPPTQVVYKTNDDHATVVGAGVTLHEALAAAEQLKKGA